jgi:hypothetical protein
MNADRFEGIMEVHVYVLTKLAESKENELAETDDAFTRGLLRGSADSFRLCAGWLQEAIEKEKAKA